MNVEYLLIVNIRDSQISIALLTNTSGSAFLLTYTDNLRRDENKRKIY